MAHSKPEALVDLSAEFAELRALSGIVEKKPGIFYFKSISFLHFHDRDGVRWADLKTKDAWQRVDLDFGASRASRKSFLRTVRLVHSQLLVKK